MSCVILFNGPVGSGKDTAADIILEEFGGSRQEFKAELYRKTAELFNVDEQHFIDRHLDRSLKEIPWAELYINPEVIHRLNPFRLEEIGLGRMDEGDFDGHFSTREALIYTSEMVIKPTFGQDYWGKAIAANLHEGINVTSDSGFVEEALPIIDKLGKDNVILVRIYRDGCSFEGDSRNYLPNDITDVTLDISNGSMEDFRKDLISSLKRWIEGRNV